MKDKIVNFIFWLGFFVTGVIAVLGVFVGITLLCVVGVASIILGAGALVLVIVPVLPWTCWCAMFERQRWESFIRMVTNQRPTAN